MVTLTRLDGHEIVVNADHILSVEHTPDTKLTLTDGHSLLVKEPVADVIERVYFWRRQIVAGRPLGDGAER